MKPNNPRCPHCKGETTTGTRGGCHTCGKVKTTLTGKRRVRHS